MDNNPLDKTGIHESIAIKLIGISGPTKWRLPQWPGPYHKFKPRSVCTYKNHPSRKLNTNHNPPAQL